MLTQSIQEIECCGMQEQPEEVGHKAMAGETIRTQAILQLVHPLFALATLDVIIVDPLRIFRRDDVGKITDHKAKIGPLGLTLSFRHDRTRMLPTVSLISKALEEPLLLPALFILLHGLVQEPCSQLFEPGIGGEAKRVA